MTTWINTPNTLRLRDAVNTVAPSRDKGADGTIGDAAHRLSVSSHNPDDTVGSKSEYTDADNVPEVRGLDIDANLNADFTAQDIVDAIVASPDRDRLKYMIYNRKIYSKSRSFVPVAYTGSDPHTGHIHFSGDPASDDDDSPWTSVLRLGGGSAQLFCKKGETGEHVKYLQGRLKNLGFDPGAIDGAYGDGTSGALKKAMEAVDSTLSGDFFGWAQAIYLDRLWTEKFAPKPPAIPAGGLTLPATVQITGNVTLAP